MNTPVTIRPLNIRSDLDGLGELVAVAFAEDATTVGTDLRAEFRMIKKLVPLVVILLRVSETFRHSFDGFVIEDGGNFIAVVVTGRLGAGSKRWEIGNVATHPDYRRQGLARKLVERAIEHAKTHGAEVCTLEVRAENMPAYQLYRSLGFEHYDSTTVMKLEELPVVRSMPVDGYTISTMQYGEWKPRYELACLETPEEVQAFLPVSQAEFRVSALERLFEPIARATQKIDAYRWAFEKDGQLVGSLYLTARRATARVVHSITMRIHPQQRANLTEPMLTLALEALQPYPRQNTRTQIRTTYTDQIEIFKRYGFVEIEVTHRLGLRFK